jgi:ParB family chromosome partitioning protein
MYVIIAGERRLRAARMAGLRSVPCVIQEGELTESQRLIEQLAENIIRADLQPVEQARAFRRLMDLNSWSARQLARELHIADANIVRALALLELPAEVQTQVEAGHLAPSVAYEVSRLDTPEEQADLAKRVVAEKLTRDQVADVVKARKSGRGVATPTTGRAEFRLDGGRKLVLSGLPDGRPETILAALKEVTRAVQTRIREAVRGNEQAA